MTSYIQIISFLISFIYGIFFYLLSKFNYYILNNKSKIIRLIITTIFIIDIVILYIYIIYKINHGYFHLYFLITLIIGFSISNVYYYKIKDKCKIYVKKILKK